MDSARADALRLLTDAIGGDADGSGDAAKVRILADSVRALADAGLRRVRVMGQRNVAHRRTLIRARLEVRGPTMSMTIANIHWFLDPFDELGITVWVDGGVTPAR